MPTALAVCGLLMAGTGVSGAAQLYWDTDGTAVGNAVATGAGLGGGSTVFSSNPWNTSSNLFWDGTSAALMLWNNANNDTAIFAGTAGLVNIGNDPILAGGLRFQTTGYTLSQVSGAAGSLTLSDGAEIHTGTGVSTIISMPLTGTNVSKTGAGSLTLSGDNSGITGAITLNAGILRAAGTTANTLGTGTLVLAGGRLELANEAAAALNRNTTVSGNAEIVMDRSVLGNALTYTLGTLAMGSQDLQVRYANAINTQFSRLNFGASTFSGTPTFTVAANAELGLGALTGAGGLVKRGFGLLALGTPAAGFSGTVDIQAGSIPIRLTHQDALGTADVSFDTAAGLEFYSDSAVTIPNNLTLKGSTYLTVLRATSGTNVTQTFSGSLTFGNNSLFLLNNNAYAYNFTGQWNLNGPVATLNHNGVGVTVGGKITGPGLFSKVSGNSLNISNAANDYTGGTNVFGASFALNVVAGGKLGNGGLVYVAPQGLLRVNAASAFTGADNATLPMAVQSSLVASAGGILSNVYQQPFGNTTATPGAGMGILELGTDFALGTAANTVAVSPFGAALRLNTAVANNLDFSAIGAQTAGNGRFFLGAATDRTYSGVLTADGGAAAGGVYRLGANDTGATVLTLSATGAGGALPDPSSGSNSVVIGSPVFNVNTGFTLSTGTVEYGGAQGYTGSTTINRGSTLRVTSTANTQNLVPSASQLNVFGQMLFSGAYNAAATSPQQTSTGAINVMNTQFTTGAGQNVGLVVNNNAYASSAIQPRLAATTGLNLSSGNFRYLGPTGAFTSSQNLGTVTFDGGNLIEVSRGNAAADNASVVVSNLVRSNNGVLTLVTTGGAFNAATGSDTKFTATQINGAAPLVTNGMLAPWIIAQTAAPTFVTSGATGLGPVAYDVTATTNTALQGATATQKVDVTTALTTGANASVYALRVGNVAISGTNTVTVGANASATDGAGVIFNSTGAQTHAVNWSFGTSGAREAVIYNSTLNQATTLSGTVNATGLTKSGPGNLTLTGTNTGAGATSLLSGTITINQGTLTAATPANVGTRANPTAPYTVDSAPIRLAGGNFAVTGATVGNANYLQNWTVANDSTFTSVTQILPRFGSLTFPTRLGGAPDPTLLTLNGGGILFTGSTVLNQAAILNATAGTGGIGALDHNYLAGAVSGTGRLEKWGTGDVTLLNGLSSSASVTQNSYSGGTIVQQGVLASGAGAAADTPFGSGSVTVQPGATLRLAHPSNVPGGIIVNSDLTGLGTVGLAYVGPVPTLTFNNTNLRGPFNGVLGIDVVGFNTTIDQAAIGGGTTFLGATVGRANTGTGIAVYGSSVFTGNLLPSGSVYRIGGGGGTLNLHRANQLTGARTVQFGALSNGLQAASVALINGTNGIVVLNQPNDISGESWFNTGQTVQLGHDQALGTSTLVFNGGILQGDAFQRVNGFAQGRVLANPVKFAGDITLNSAFNGSPSDLTFTGPVSLSNSTVGGALRVITVNTPTYAPGLGSIATFSGVISDGDSANNGLVKKRDRHAPSHKHQHLFRCHHHQWGKHRHLFRRQPRNQSGRLPEQRRPEHLANQFYPWQTARGSLQHHWLAGFGRGSHAHTKPVQHVGRRRPTDQDRFRNSGPDRTQLLRQFHGVQRGGGGQFRGSVGGR